MSPQRHLYTIAPDRAFLDTLAAGLLARTAAEPKLLAETTVLLPTRRACRALLEAFVRRSEGRALLLPSLRPLGEVDDDEITIEDGAGEEVAGRAVVGGGREDKGGAALSVPGGARATRSVAT